MKTPDSFGSLINDNGDDICDGGCVTSMLCMYIASVFSAEDTNNLTRIDTSTYRDRYFK